MNTAETRIPFNEGRLGRTLLVTLLLILPIMILIALCISVLFLNTPALGTWHRVLSALLLLVLAPGTIFLISQIVSMCQCLMKRLPAFIFSSEGLIDHGSTFSVGLIPWNELIAVSPPRPSDGAFLEQTLILHLKDPQFLLSCLPWYKQLAFRLEPRKARLLIPGGVLSIPAKEFIQRVDLYTHQFQS